MEILDTESKTIDEVEDAASYLDKQGYKLLCSAITIEFEGEAGANMVKVFINEKRQYAILVPETKYLKPGAMINVYSGKVLIETLTKMVLAGATYQVTEELHDLLSKAVFSLNEHN